MFWLQKQLSDIIQILFNKDKEGIVGAMNNLYNIFCLIKKEGVGPVSVELAISLSPFFDDVSIDMPGQVQ